MAQKRNRSRRGLLIILAGLVALAWGWPQINPRDTALRFAPIKGLPGWQSAETGALSGGAADAVFLGLGDTPLPPLAAKDLCATLFPAPRTRLAVFTDINCPNCRSFEAKLAARDLAITWLQLPLLGPGSETAARVAIAAETLSGQPAAPPRALRGTGVEALLRHHGKTTGLVPQTLKEEAHSPRTDAILTRHERAADTLGVYGTPAFVIGKTLVLGDLSEPRLDALLALDHAACD
ncbi:MAG: hypothetical protein OIF48_12875 [Silicimonas sp.]|nr:hypothetical protein [Silicimonas sp.]